MGKLIEIIDKPIVPVKWYERVSNKWRLPYNEKQKYFNEMMKDADARIKKLQEDIKEYEKK
jgi:hypothetical protein